MKTRLRKVNDHGKRYDALLFACPGCAAGGPVGYLGIHLLPVNAPDIGKPSWDWDGDLEAPTLSPSILTHEHGLYPRCHSFLKAGVFEFLKDSTHPLAGQHVLMPDLPEWAERLS